MRERKAVYISALNVFNIRCFHEGKLNLSGNETALWRKWTVILGDNATGKTTLLQALASFNLVKDNHYGKLQDYDEFYYPLGRDWGEGYTSCELEVVIENQEIVNIYYDNDFEGSSSSTHNEPNINNLIVYGYGSQRHMSSRAISDNKDHSPNTLFDENAKLINAEEWLLQLDYIASKPSDVQNYAAQRRTKVELILKEVLPDIDEIKFGELTKENLKPTVEFKSPYGWVNIHELSLGYKTMVAWVVDLAARMFERYPDSDNPLAEPAIVLVDEIDLHLHPKWQRKIFEYLDELFPKTQFIVTAHSPLVVQSAPKDANIVLLRREGDHVVIDQDIKSVNKWRIDQILTGLFGVESSWSKEITDLLKERTELIQKGELSHEEKDRLDELNNMAHNLPTSDNKEDNEAMDIIRRAAELLKNK